MKKIHQCMTNYQMPLQNVRQNFIVNIFLQVSCEYDISGELLYLFSIFRSDVSGGCRIADQCSAAPSSSANIQINGRMDTFLR